jgi:hypothetical protein
MTEDNTAKVLETDFTGTERRKYKRVPSICKVIVKHPTAKTKLKFKAVNLCTAGILVDTHIVKFKKGEKFELTLVADIDKVTKIYCFDSTVVHRTNQCTGFSNVRRKPPDDIGL